MKYIQLKDKRLPINGCYNCPINNPSIGDEDWDYCEITHTDTIHECVYNKGYASSCPLPDDPDWKPVTVE